MIRLVWRTDVHLSDKAPLSRKDDWTEAVLGKLHQTIRVANKVKADAILDGGDFFHIKSPVQNSHRLIRQVADLHAECECPVYANIGNHDCVFGDYSYIDQQPLGVLFSTGVFQRCYDEHEAIFEKDGFKVRVVGVPYHGTKYEIERFDRIERGDEDFLVVIAHVLASNEGGHMFDNEDIIAYADLMDHPADAFCFLPGTIVTDWNGRALPIEEVRDEAAIQGRDGPVVVEQAHPVRQVDEDVVVLDVEGVPSDLIPGVTAEHPFWVARGLRCRLPSRVQRRCHPDKVRTSHPCASCHEPPEVVPEWRAAREIETGDYMAIPFPKIPSDAISEPGLARLLGYYIAEGHIIENRDKVPVAGVGWSFHSEETDLHQDVARLVDTHFGLAVHEHSLVPRGNNSIQVCAYGRDLAEFFQTQGGRHAPRKVLSSWAWRLAANSRLELLIGWMLGDGHARNSKPEVMGGTTSPRLATQMFLLALSLGLRPCYTIRPASEVRWSGGHVSPQLPFHCITFYGDDAEMLSHRMGVEPPPRSKTKVAGFFYGGLFWRRVRGTFRKHYNGPVYNMRTSTQEYVAGLLLTHNCFGHWHKNQGVQVSEDGSKTFVNIGSLTRGALTQDNMHRNPAMALLEFDPKKGVQVKVVKLKVRPPEEVFDTERREQMRERNSTIDAFVRKIQSELTDSNRISLEDKVRSMDISEEVREHTLSYMEKANAG